MSTARKLGPHTHTIKYLRRTTSAAAVNGLGNTLNEHSPAMHNEARRGQRPEHHDQVSAMHNERRHGQRPGATIKFLRCTTCGAASYGLGTTIEYLVNKNAGTGNNWANAHIHKSWARIQINPPCSVAAFVVNSEPHTEERPSVRLFVGPELHRCVR
jgi:hypothetical protein